MAVNDTLKFRELTKTLISNNCNNSLIIEALKSYFQPKAPKNVLHFIRCGFKILKKFLLMENMENIQAAEKLLIFTKKQVRNAVTHGNFSEEKLWNFLTNLWESTKFLIEMDSNVDLSEFASWLLKFIIDFGAENKHFSLPSKDFIIEENLSFIDDHLSGSPSIEIALKLKSVIQPGSRNYDVIFPIARYIFQNQEKKSNIENFLKIAFLAKIILYKSKNRSIKASNLLETFFKKAILPPNFFSWAEHHLNMKKPKEVKKMNRNKILTYILNHLDLKLTHQTLYREDSEAKYVNVNPNGNIKMVKRERQIQKNAQCNATSPQNDLQVKTSDPNVIISSSGPFLICVDKNSEHKKIQNGDLKVNRTKNKTKLEENKKSESRVIPPLKCNIQSLDSMNLKKPCKTSPDGLKSSVGKGNKETVNSVEHTEKNRKKRKRRPKNKSDHDLEHEIPSKKQKNSDHLTSDSNSAIHPSETQVHLPEKSSFNVYSKASSKNISEKKLPLVSKNLKVNWTVSDIEKKNTLKPIDLPNKRNKITEKKCDKINIHKGSVILKRKEKRKLKKSSALKMVTSNSTTFDHHDKTSKRDLNKCVNKDELNHSNKNILSKLNTSLELVEIPCKKRRRKPKHSNKFESAGFQQGIIEPKVVHGPSVLKASTSKIIEKKKATVNKVNKMKESEVDEASGSDSDIVPNDLENSMFTKEETRAYHQLQLKELKENEKRQKIKVFFDKVDSEISDSVRKLETDKAGNKISPSKLLVDSQDIVLSSLYKKTDGIEAEESFVKSDPQPSVDEEVLPYGDDKIEDLQIVFSTVKKDLKTKFQCNIKEEHPSEEDSILPVQVKESKPVEKRSVIYESHPDNLFNIYSKNDDINIISCCKPINSCLNKVKLSINSETKNLKSTLNRDKQDLLSQRSELNEKKKPSQIGFIETDITECQNTDESGSPSTISKNQLVLKGKRKIEDDFVVNQNNSLIETSNAEVVCKEKQVCSNQHIHNYFAVSDKDKNENATDGLTVNEIEILDSSHFNLRESEDSRLHEEKEAVDTLTENFKESEKSFTLILDESSDDCSTNKMDKNESSADNIKLSEKTIIPENVLNETLKDDMETPTSKNVCDISNEIAPEQRSDKENVKDNDIDTAVTFNETEDSADVLNVISDKVSDALIITRNSRTSIEILKGSTGTPISESVEIIGDNICEASIEKSMKKKEQSNSKDENLVEDMLESKSPHRKALTFEVLENSSECRSEILLDNPLKLQKENEENSENKENIVNNKQEESVEMSSLVSSNSINEIFSEKKNHTPSCNELPKIKMTKYKSPAKRKSFLENSPVSNKNIICLTPLKVASAALSNEIIISPDVSDEENTAKAINSHIVEENIIQSNSESVVTLDQTSHEEEQIRDENDHSYSIDFRSREDKPLTKFLKENYNFKESEHFHNSPPLEILELSPVSISSSESKQSPNLSVTEKTHDLSQKDDQLKNSTKKSPLIRPKISPDKNSSLLDENNEMISTVIRKSKHSDNTETSKSELDNSVETQEELESKDKVPSIITRYSLRRNRNLATPEKDIMKPVRKRRNSVSSVKSENEIEVLSSPSYKTRRSLTAVNLTPVRRSRRISELSVDRN